MNLRKVLMLKLSRQTLVALLLLSLLACVRTLPPQDPDAKTGYYHQLKRHDNVSLVINKPVNTDQFRDVVYVKMNNHSSVNSYEFQDYTMRAFEGIGFFDKVVTSEPTAYINTGPIVGQNIAGKTWYETSDPVDIKSLRGRYENFVIAEVTLREDKPSQGKRIKNLSFEIKFIDPNNGQTLSIISSQGRSWGGVDKTLVNPVLNTTRDWLNMSSKPVVDGVDMNVERIN